MTSIIQTLQGQSEVLLAVEFNKYLIHSPTLYQNHANFKVTCIVISTSTAALTVALLQASARSAENVI